MIYTLFILCWIVTATAFFGTLAMFTGFFSKTGNVPHKVAICWARTILFVSRVKVRTTGLEHLDPEKSYIFMANHASNFDILALFAGLPFQFRWLAKAELFKIPIFAQGMRGCGYISIDRKNQESAFRSLREAGEKIRNGASVMIFPEGTRSMDGRLLPFKKGGFVLAKDAGVPIIPLVITGSRDIMPKKRMRIQSGTILIKILPQIDTRPYSDQPKEILMDMVYERLHREMSASEGVAR